tara:strand:+ start:6794 stop:7105 length:312 start_codon:yes stop_codon:yes gene_type:complete
MQTYKSNSQYGKLQTSSVITTFDLNLKSFTDFDITLTGDTAFTISGLPPVNQTLSFTMIIRGSFVPTFPVGWVFAGDSYSGAVDNFHAVHVNNLKVTAFITNL